MRLSRKTKYVLLGLLLIFNIILRLPVTPHEIAMGADSCLHHALANSISINGYAKWILNPLSFFGLYPFSYPSGEIFFLSGVSQCSCVEMEWTIWIAATFFGIFGVLTSYLLAKEIVNDFLFAFSVAFIYSTSRMFIGFTNWTVSTRGLFMAILPLLIWSLLRSYNQKGDRLKYGLLSIGLLILLGTIHRMVFFTPLVLIAFGVSVLCYTANKKFKVPKITPKVSIILFFALFIPLFLLPFTPLGFYHNIEALEAGHYYGYFFHGSAPYHILLNLGAEYAMAVGILIPLILIGAFLLLLKRQRTFGEVYSLALILCFAPFLADPTYMRFFVLFIFSLLIGFGLLGIIKMLGKVGRVKNIVPMILVIILAFSALLPYFVVVRPVPSLPFHTSHVNELTYDAALFIKAHGVELPRISASISLLPRINAIAGPPYQHRYFVERDRMRSWTTESISSSNFISDFLKYKSLYEVKKPFYEYFEYFGCDNMYVKRALGNKIYLVIEDNYLPSRLPFYICIRATKPRIYDNGLESIWYLSY